MANKNKFHSIQDYFTSKFLLASLLSGMLSLSFAQQVVTNSPIANKAINGSLNITSPTPEALIANTRLSRSNNDSASNTNKLDVNKQLAIAKSSHNQLKVSSANKQQGAPNIIRVIPAGINAADNDANEMNQLKRQLELAKIQSQIAKQRGDLNPREVKYPSSNNATLVTAVIIDKDEPSNSVATLLFDDGGTLDVGLGSKLAGYNVSAINLDGVVLTKSICRSHHASCTQHLKIKRIYANTLNDQDAAKNFVPYTATHVLGDVGGSDSTSTTRIPPIYKNK